MSTTYRPIKRRPFSHFNDQDFTTFAGFKGLTSLSVLDMDNLDLVEEIAQCIRSSSSSLRELELSFSEALALKARKKPTSESDTETAPEEDEFGDEIFAPPPPLPSAQAESGSSSTSLEAEIRKERNAQDKVFGQILDLDSPDAEKKHAKKVEKTVNRVDAETQAAILADSHGDAERLFVKDLKLVVKSLIVQASGEGSSQQNPDRTLQLIEKAATRYLESNPITKNSRKKLLPKKAVRKPAKPKVPTMPMGYSISQPGSSSQPVLSFDGMPVDIDLSPFNFGSYLGPGSPMPELPPSGSFPPPVFSSVGTPPPPMPNFPSSSGDNKSKKKKNTAKSSALKVTDNPGSSALVEWANGYAKTKGSAKSDKAGIAIAKEEAEAAKSGFNSTDSEESPLFKPAKVQFDDDIDLEHPDEVGDEDSEEQEFLESPESSSETETRIDKGKGPALNGRVREPSPLKNELLAPVDKGKGPLRDIQSQGVEPEEDEESIPTERLIQDYIRSQHGIPLEVLRVYLMPIKAHQLCRAIDVSTLKEITLLHVGPQRQLWSMLTKVHKSQPLQLTSITTDNVTPAFLLFLENLDKLEDLFIFERDARSKVESFAPKTPVGIDDIRKQALKKHLPTLKRLVIKNEDDSSWVANRETAYLIARKGKQLKEFGAAFNHASFVSHATSSHHDLHLVLTPISSIENYSTDISNLARPHPKHIPTPLPRSPPHRQHHRLGHLPRRAARDPLLRHRQRRPTSAPEDPIRRRL